MILGLRDATRIRRTEVQGADGRTTFAVESETPVKASVQPLADRQREVLPEGIRQRVDKRAWSHSHFQAADQMTNKPSDLLLYEGEIYEVAQVKKWPQLLSHYEIDLIRVAEGDNDWPPEED